MSGIHSQTFAKGNFFATAGAAGAVFRDTLEI